MSNRPYGSKEYWDKRYSKCEAQRATDDETNEWLLSYADIRGILAAAMPLGKDSRVLDVGCGNSKLLPDLRDNGHSGELVGIDISGISVARTVCGGKDIQVEEVDATTAYTVFGADAFEVVLDKSTIDAMLCDDTDGMTTVRSYAQQVSGLLCVGGCFFVVSHNHPEGRHRSDDEEVEQEQTDDALSEWLQVIIDGLNTGPVPTIATTKNKRRKLQGGDDGVRNPQNQGKWSLDIHVSMDDAPSIYVFRKLRRSSRRVGRVEAEMQIRVHEH